MPNAIEGLDSTLKALRKLSPETYKQMNRELKPALKSITAEAKSYLPSTIAGLSNWTNASHEAKSRTGRAKAFPSYDATKAKSGITYSSTPRKLNTRGWTALYAIWNLTPSGAIVDTAGRKNRDGNLSSKSNNPMASKHFIDAIAAAAGGFFRVGTAPRSVGRIIYQAVNKDDGKAKAAIIDAVNKATEEVARSA